MNTLFILNQNRKKLVTVNFKPEFSCHSRIIICHGFTGAKENSGRLKIFAHKLNQMGIEVWAFDFTGHGQSEGDFSTVTLSRQISDLKHVMDYICNPNDLPLFLLGRSFGGSTILGAGSDPRVKGCIFWSAPVHLEETFRNNLGDEYRQLEEGYTISRQEEDGKITTLKPALIKDFVSHNMDSNLQALKSKPVLIVHGKADDVVGYHNAEYIKEKVPTAQLHLVPQADHRFTGWEALREDLTIEWLKSILKKS
jgi:alpha-beta hydrolase superfamily lysophospholipase